MANVNIRMDSETKKKAEVIFYKLGLTPTTAINLFYRQVIRTNSIPFELVLEEPNEETLSAMKEVEDIKKRKNQSKDLFFRG